MKKIFLVISILIILFGCKKIIRQFDDFFYKDDVKNVSSDNAEMNKIIDDARKSVGDFIKELENTETKSENFSIKFPFKTDSGLDTDLEHIWLTDIVKENGKYFGIVANEPYYIDKMKLGDKVEFDINKISDWYYIDGEGYLVGGKSIIYFYNKSTEEEKKEFDESAGFKFKK